MAKLWDAVVVGGGVVGLAVLRELTVHRGWRCLLLEASPHLVSGASSGGWQKEEARLCRHCFCRPRACKLEVWRVACGACGAGGACGACGAWLSDCDV